jgi:DNA repair protein RecO (recombination protein O)
MLYKTRGIVLNYLKYKDTSIIVKVFTEEFGLQSYILNGIRNHNAKTKIALFQPLTLLELVVYHKEKQEIHRINEAKCAFIYQSIPYEIKKIAMSAFIVEVFQKCVQPGDKNQSMYTYFHDFLLELDHTIIHFEDFHVYFMFSLSKYLGFEPANHVDFMEQIKKSQPRFSLVLQQPEITSSIEKILSKETKVPFETSIRRTLIDIWLAFYQIHHDNFGELKSLSVLREI